MSIKSKSKYVCQSCGYESPKWLGRCPECTEWGTLQEEVERQKVVHNRQAALPTKLQDISQLSLQRLSTSIAELDRVLGGGIVPGEVVLVGGDPGIGKSTLLMQLTGSLARQGLSVLYISGEESLQQTKMRADRLGVVEGQIFLAAETEVDTILSHLDATKPSAAVVDSIQTVYDPTMTSAPGTVGQIRESASRLIRHAKTSGTALFLVGHVTKDGSIGPIAG